MDKWEYMMRVIYANSDNTGADEHFDEGERIPRFHYATTLPVLDRLGQQGWELVHMEPIVSVGRQGELHLDSGPYLPARSRTYFCVFKRRIES